MLIYFGYEININAMDGGFGRTMFHGIINLGMARAVAGIGLGYMFAIEWTDITEMETTEIIEERPDNRGFWIISALEILTLSMPLVDFFLQQEGVRESVYCGNPFPIFLVCLLTRKGIVQTVRL